jgi:hypothetical protein
MSRHAKDYDARKASAMETARWLLPELHRAIDRGLEVVELSVRDVKEVLAYMEATAQREKVQFSGKHLGFADPEMMRDLMTRNRASAPVLFKKTGRYCVEIFYLELPPNANQLAKREAQPEATN